MGRPGCPTPAKKGYKTREQAAKHMWSLWKKKKQQDRFAVRPYRCPCGDWHVGHDRAHNKRGPA